ncbi:MAG: glycosyltransferase [Chloroflexi bacterium]|nr:glycosyltransferase [Chloroflexota bacterium]
MIRPALPRFVLSEMAAHAIPSCPETLSVTKRVLFLFSDTGGGHRSAFQAIQDAMKIRYGDAVDFDAVDVLRECKWPLNKQPELYPRVVNTSKLLWALVYHSFDGKRRTRLARQLIYRNNRRNLRRIVSEHPADVVVCTHSVIGNPTFRAFLTLDERPPFLTVVTDLVTTPSFWYDPRVDHCFVPTETAYRRGLRLGMSPSQMQITGLPVNPHFIQSMTSKELARKEFGFDPRLPAVLLVAGSEGMGAIHKTVAALDAQPIDAQLIVVCGRNEELRTGLENRQWTNPHHVFGYVSNHHEMPRIMAASDIIVTKAGPSTISEAAIAGLPMIISDRIPGQETGNVRLVTENQAGIYLPKPEKVAERIVEWLKEDPDKLRQRAENARRIARPEAVWDIAEAVWDWANRPKFARSRAS